MPTQQELDALPPDRRLELLDLEHQQGDRRHQRRHRQLNTWILAAGVLATVGTLLVTGLTLRSGQEQLNIAREGQVTDRYAKAVEQLGSDKREVRTAAVYALERISKDSDRDRLAIRDVLAAFVRERDPDPTVKTAKLPKEPESDVAAALTVLSRRLPDPRDAPILDLHAIRVPGPTFPPNTNLRGADLSNADLRGANLSNADLRGANLHAAYLGAAELDGADLNGAVLGYADLRNARLQGAKLRGANLIHAQFTGADLSKADLHGADLARVNLHAVGLRGANLSNANLLGAVIGLDKADFYGVDLSGADLRGTGLSEKELRAHAIVINEDTKLGPIE